MARRPDACKVGTVANGCLGDRWPDKADSGLPRRTRRLRSTSAYPALALLASALLIGTSVQAVAQSQNFNPILTPQLNRVYAGCTLASTTVQSLMADLTLGGKIAAHQNGDPEIAFVVVYALSNDNDGQPVTVGGTRGFTGPVICRNEFVTGIALTSPTSPIPASGTVDTLDAEDAFILRYVLNDGANAGTIEKVICHTVNKNTDCFRISPLLP